MTDFKSGFVSIVGRPNAGKSTLINQLVKQKIAIVTDKPQTTRDAIIGVLTEEKYQIIFTDTPGVHKPKHELGNRMNAIAYSNFRGMDLIYYLMDASVPFGTGDQFIIDKLAKVKTPIILVLNKIDAISQDALLLRIVEMKEKLDFAEIVPLSALNNANTDTLLDVTLSYLDDGIMYYPKDTVSAYPEQFIIAEIIREKIINLTEEEIPHSVAVAIEKMVRKKNVLVISVVIFVNRDSQKGMIIGKQGKMISQIGQQAREELESLLGEKVYLENYVRVEKNWRNKDRLLNQLGYIEIEEA